MTMQMDRPVCGTPADRPPRSPMGLGRRAAHVLRRLTVVAYVLVGAIIGGSFAVVAHTSRKSTESAPPTSRALVAITPAITAAEATTTTTTTTTVDPAPATAPLIATATETAVARAAGAAPTTTVAAPTQPFVGITLKDFAVLTGARAATAGPLDFDVANVGPQPHEFLVFASELPAAQLPLGPDGRVDETGVGVTKVFDSGDNVAVGTSTTFHTLLTPGHYVLICNLPGHYAAGMRASFTITT